MIMRYIDYRKAFDLVNWNKLWQVLQEMGVVPDHLIKLVMALYLGSVAVVKIKDATSKEFFPQSGVRQGCILTPILFNIYGEYIMRNALHSWEGGIRIGGVQVRNLWYAYDTTIFASIETEIATLLRRIERRSRRFVLKIIKEKKTKLIVVNRATLLQRMNELYDLGVVDSLIYLGSTVCSDGRCEAENKSKDSTCKKWCYDKSYKDMADFINNSNKRKKILSSPWTFLTLHTVSSPEL